jgi:hypothetical protein
VYLLNVSRNRARPTMKRERTSGILRRSARWRSSGESDDASTAASKLKRQRCTSDGISAIIV